MLRRNEHETELQHDGNARTSKELENAGWSGVKKICWKIKAKQTTWCLQENLSSGCSVWTAIWYPAETSCARRQCSSKAVLDLEVEVIPGHIGRPKLQLVLGEDWKTSCYLSKGSTGQAAKVWSIQQYCESEFWYHFAQWEWLQLIQCVRILPGIFSCEFCLERSHLADFHTSFCTRFRVTQLDVTVPNECAVTPILSLSTNTGSSAYDKLISLGVCTLLH